MKLFNKLIITKMLAMILYATSSIQGKVVSFAGDPYSLQANEQLVAAAHKAAFLAEFNEDYEVIMPKKAALEINPWNKFIAYGINPHTKNPFIIINPEWFNVLPSQEQQFLLVRAFTFLQESINSFLKVIPYLFILLRLCLLLIIFLLLSKTRLKDFNLLIRIVVSWGSLILLNLTVLHSFDLKIINYYSQRFDNKVIELAVKKTKDKDSAIRALEYFDLSIKNELQKGEAFWVPFELAFEDYARQLKNKDFTI